MTPETHELWSGVLSLVAFLLWNMYREARRDLDGLKTQNGKQETDIATLQANGNAHNLNTERLASAIERLDTKIDQLSQSLLTRHSKAPPAK